MGALALFLPTAPVFASSAPGAEVAFAGVCPMMSLEVTFSPPLTTTPSTVTTIDVDGTGECIMQDGDEYTGTLNGTGTTLPMAGHITCAGGVVSTTGTFTTTFDGFSDMTGPMVIAFAGGVASITLVSTAVSSLGTGQGAFLQDPDETIDCAQSTGLSSTTWEGPFVFECRGNLVNSH